MLKPFIPVFVWALVILGLSTMPGVSIPSTWADLISLDKLAHCIVYGLLAYIGLRALDLSGLYLKKWVILSILLGCAYGVLMEFIQYAFFPDRYFEVLDIIANIIGSLAGAWIYNFFYRRKSVAK